MDMCKAWKDWRQEGVDEGVALGMERGIERGIRAFILDKLEDGVEKGRIITKLAKSFSLEESQAEAYYKEYVESSQA